MGIDDFRRAGRGPDPGDELALVKLALLRISAHAEMEVASALQRLKDLVPPQQWPHILEELQEVFLVANSALVRTRAEDAINTIARNNPILAENEIFLFYKKNLKHEKRDLDCIRALGRLGTTQEKLAAEKILPVLIPLHFDSPAGDSVTYALGDIAIAHAGLAEHLILPELEQKWRTRRFEPDSTQILRSIEKAHPGSGVATKISALLPPDAPPAPPRGPEPPPGTPPALA